MTSNNLKTVLLFPRRPPSSRLQFKVLFHRHDFLELINSTSFPRRREDKSRSVTNTAVTLRPRLYFNVLIMLYDSQSHTMLSDALHQQS